MSAPRIRLALLAGVMVLAAAAPSLAQTAGLTITPGTEIRLTPLAPGAARTRGRVVVLARDTIVIRDDERVTRAAIADLSSIEVRGGEDKRRGFLIGAGIAAGITGVFGGIDASKGNITMDDFVGTMIVNALIGGLVGYAFAPKGWERIPLPSAAP